MARDDLAGIPDGETLRHLESGLEIVRRRKHEPIDLDRFSREERRRLTDKRFGSKFSAEWAIDAVTDWMEAEIVAQGLKPGRPESIDVLLDNPVGVASGETTSTIRIMSDGRYVHAFPVEDQR